MLRVSWSPCCSVLVVLLLVTFVTVYRAQLIPVDEACKQLQCNNGGSPTVIAEWCFCSCPADFTGLICDVEIQSSDWPSGPYILPMAVSGCPEKEGQGWFKGHLKMTFTEKLPNFKSEFNMSIPDEDMLSSLGPYSEFAMQFNFCYKQNRTEMNVPDAGVYWPFGSFKMYRAGGVCPSGFAETIMRLDLPPILQYNIDGFIPDMELNDTDTQTVLNFYTCDRISDWPPLSQIAFPKKWFHPFIFLKDSSCIGNINVEVKVETIFMGFLTHCVYRLKANPSTDHLEDETLGSSGRGKTKIEPLGMTSREIRNFQISAPTQLDNHAPHFARYLLQGWCHAPGFTGAYLQVDLLLPTLINGIRIFNWASRTPSRVGNRYQPVYMSMSIQEFTLKYGFSTSFLADYRTSKGIAKFILDASLPFHVEQDFILKRSLILTLLRVYGHNPPPERTFGCLKLELLGRKRAERLSLHCPHTGTRFWVQSKTLLVPTDTYYNPVEFNNLTLSSCKAKCVSMDSNSSGLTYISSRNVCYIDTLSYTSNYVEFRSDHLSVHLQRLCIAPERNPANFSALSIITNYAYPLSDPALSNFSLEIIGDLTPRAFIFTNISFGKSMNCRSEMSIIGDNVLHLFGQQQQLFVPINSNKVKIVSNYCPSFATEEGNRFRLLVKKLEIPWYTSSGKNIYSNKSLTSKEGKLASNSYLGLMGSKPRHEYWRIVGTNQFVVLRVLEMDIGCESSSFLKFEHTTSPLTQICNCRRLIGSIRSVNHELVVQYRHVPNSAFLEGFIAEYRLESAHGTNAENPWPPSVCVDSFKKCYMFVNNNNSSFSALEAMDNCKLVQGSSSKLVRIRTKQEDDFLKQFIISNLRRLDSYQNTSHLGYAYIGLSVFQVLKLTKGLRFIWTDGMPLTYTAWYNNDKPLWYGEYCTRMAMHTFSSFAGWEPIRCDDLKANYYVCENRTDQDKGELGNLHRQLVNMNIDTITEESPRLFACGSGEFILYWFVCDNSKDCSDGSDEYDCLPVDGEHCPEGSFSCNDGQCIPLSAICDFRADCLDNSDEFCDFPTCRNMSTCTNHQCIDDSLKCNGDKDCIDGSDEISCHSCQTGAILCKLWTDGINRKTCLHPSMVCDGHHDCYLGEDERECNVTCLDSCNDWFVRGYTHTGEYCIDGNRVECNFDVEGLTYTIYYDMEQDSSVGGSDIKVVYGSLQFVERLVEKNNCTQAFRLTCKPPEALVAQHEKIGDNRGFWDCFCVKFTIYGFSNVTRSVEACSNETELQRANRNLTGFDEISLRLKDVSQLPVQRITFDADVQPRVTFENIMCVTERLGDDTISCRNGTSTFASKRCIYQIDIKNGRFDGCQDLSHLQDCGPFPCPVGFLKCPDSYCIPIHYLCDGNRQCPEGDDEDDCGCVTSVSQVVLMQSYFESSYDDYTSLLQLASYLKDGFDNNNTHILMVEVLPYTIHANSFLTGYYKMPLGYNLNPARSVTLSSMTNEVNSYMMKGHALLAVFVKMESISRAIDMLTALNTTLFNNTSTLIVYVGWFSREEKHSFSRLPILPSGTMFTQVNYLTPELLASKEFDSICQGRKTPSCPGLFRCRGTRQCLQPALLCDGEPQCPLGDDERLCHFTCPQHCKCAGYSVDCSKDRLNQSTLPNFSTSTRSIDLHLNNLSVVESSSNLTFLFVLNMSRTNLPDIPRKFFSSMNNLHTLDLSYNKIVKISEGDFQSLTQLKSLSFEGNYHLRTLGPRSFISLNSLRILVIQRTEIDRISADTFKGLTLTLLDLSYNQLQKIEDYAFRSLNATTIDLKHNDIKLFSDKMFKGVISLRVINSDSYSICCVKPDSVLNTNCTPFRDEFSSCTDLMRIDALRFLLWIVGFLALIGNALSLFYRLKYDRKRLKLGYGVFVTNLSVADFLMGVYLLVVAIADSNYRGNFSMYDKSWRTSNWCTFAGVVSTLSSEASVLFLCLITFDRILVIKYPYGDRRFKTKSASFASVCVWIIGSTVALLPVVVKGYFKDEFYSKSVVCLALPLTAGTSAGSGSGYSIAIFIGLNLVAFLMVAMGQLLIFREVRKTAAKVKRTQKRSSDLRVARNLLLVVATDFMCWFPICLMAFLALGGTDIPADLYAWSAVLILPVNSALNPFLYTFSAVIGKQMLTPSLTEQSRQPDLWADKTGKLLNIWNEHWILQKPMRTKALVPLSTFSLSFKLSAKDILKITHAVIKTMYRLHSQRIVTDGFTFDDVLLELENGKITKVRMTLTPKRMTVGMSRSSDIYRAGELTHRLLSLRRRLVKPRVFKN